MDGEADPETGTVLDGVAGEDAVSFEETGGRVAEVCGAEEVGLRKVAEDFGWIGRKGKEGGIGLEVVGFSFWVMDPHLFSNFFSHLPDSSKVTLDFIFSVAAFQASVQDVSTSAENARLAVGRETLVDRRENDRIMVFKVKCSWRRREKMLEE